MSRSLSTSARSLRRWAGALSVAALALVGLVGPASAADAVGGCSGVVTDEDGAGIAGVLVQAYDSDGEPVGFGAVTGADGSYVAAGVPVGDWAVRFIGWDGGYVDAYYPGVYDVADAVGVPVVDGVTTTGVDVVLQLGGGLYGTVTDPDGVPVDDMPVYLTGPYGTHVATTLAGGHYEFTALPAGEYVVEFAGGAVGLLFEYYDGSYDLASATPVSVVVGARTGPIDAQLAYPGSISGRVTGPNGLGVAGVSVRATAALTQSGGEATTGADGTYTIDGLTPDSYVVQFDGSGDGWAIEYWDDVSAWEHASPVTVEPGTTTSGIDAVLALGGTITGTVRGPDGLGIDGLMVSAWTEAGTAALSGITDSSGAYRIDGVPVGVYLVFFDGYEFGLVGEYYDDAAYYDDADPVTITAGGTRSGIDATLGRSGSIGGTVTGPGGAPAAGVLVSGSDSRGATETAYTEDDGTYVLSGLRPGTYTVYFDGSGAGLISEYYDDVAHQLSAVPVTVVAGARTGGIDASLAAGGSISGTVTGPLGPVVGVFVRAWQGQRSYEATTDADGDYAIRGLPAGDYTVEFDAADLGLVREYYDDVLDADDATPVAVTPGVDRGGIDAVLVRGGVITGTVTGPGGTPVHGAWVTALGELHGATPMGTTDADGHYDLIGLPADSYRVHFSGAEVGLVSEYYDDVLDPTTAALVVVDQGQVVAGIDARLAVGASISGRVTGPSGAAADVWVSASSIDGIGTGWASTGVDGRYTITGLAPGSYRVHFWPDDPTLRQEYYDDAISARAATLVPVVGTAAVTGIDAVLAPRSVPLFTDVPAGHPFIDAIEWLAESGVTTGFPDGGFHPSAPVERQAMAAFLYRFAGEPAFTTPTTPTFTDVPTGHPFFREIEWLASTGITTGWPDGTFRPSASVERQAMAAFLYRFADEPEFTDPPTASFVDVPTTSPFFTEIEWLASTRITTGWSDGTFRPTNRVERQAMAAFLMRFDTWRWS